MPILGARKGPADAEASSRSGSRLSNSPLLSEQPRGKLWKAKILAFHASQCCLSSGIGRTVWISDFVKREQYRECLRIDLLSFRRGAKFLERERACSIVFVSM